MPLPRNPKLKIRSQELRRNATNEEKHLWYDYLCLQKERWRRQVIIEGFIVDFYCSSARLAIELDGSQHYTEQGKQYDSERSAILAKHAVAVLRFSNQKIAQDFPDVCCMIARTVNDRLTQEASSNACY